MEPVDVQIGGTYETQDENGIWRLVKILSYSYDDFPLPEGARPPFYKVQFLTLGYMLNGISAGPTITGPVMTRTAAGLRPWMPSALPEKPEI